MWVVSGCTNLPVRALTRLGGRNTVFNKKLLFTALLAVAGYLGYKRVRSERAEQDLWAEATDPVQPRDLR